MTQDAERCAVPGCETMLFNGEGICDACDSWVDEEVAKLEAEGELSHFGGLFPCEPE